VSLGGRMESEIGEQPSLLARNAQRYFEELSEWIQPSEYQLVTLAARGSSDNAALYLRYLIEVNWKIPAMLIAPSVLTKFHSRVRYPRSLCVGISQSGAAPDVAAVLQTMRDAGHATLAIVNTADSLCAASAEHALDLGVGEERSVAATKTYTASLLACYQLARCGAELEPPKLPDERFLELCQSSALAWAPTVSNAGVVFALGRGYSFCSAHECALKLMECALVSCKAYSSADFQHGPKALLADDSVLILFGDVAGEGFGRRCIEALGSGEVWGPIWDAIFAQRLALEIARLRGLDPDAPAHLSKVTKTL